MKILSLTLLPLLFGSLNGVSLNAADTQTHINVDSGAAINIPTPPSDKEIENYYSYINASEGVDLLAQVRDLTISKHKTYTVYDDMGKYEYYKMTDYDPKNPKTNVIDFYTHASAKGDWEQPDIPKNKPRPWSREHVWCAKLSNSVWDRRGSTDNSLVYGGADMHHLRMVDKSINSSRQDSPYGDLEGYKIERLEKPVLSSETLYHYGDRYEGIFEPIDEVKGDAARIILYQFIHYNTPTTLAKNNIETSMTPIGDENIKVDNGKGNVGDLSLSNIIKDPKDPKGNASSQYCFDILMKWNKQDPVDELEINRNNGAYSVQGNRNPFIDHPEYINAIWGNQPLVPLDDSEIVETLNITNKPSKTTYSYMAKVENQNEGLKVMATFKDGHEDDVTHRVKIGSVDTSKLGYQDIKVSLNNKSTTYEVFVTSKDSVNEKFPVYKDYASNNPDSKTWSKTQQTGELNGVSWTFNGDSTNSNEWYFRGNSTSGLQMGKSDNAFKDIVISTEHFVDKPILEVKITTKGASNTDATVDVKVNDKSYLKPIAINDVADTVYTFSGSSAGKLEIIYHQTKDNAIYLKNIQINYQDGETSLYTPLDQAKAWSNYLIKETEPYYKNGKPKWEEFKTIVDNHHWDTLKQEYNLLSDEVKNLILTSEDTTIKEARDRYQDVINRFENVDNFLNLERVPIKEFVLDKKMLIMIGAAALALIIIIIIIVIIVKHKKKAKKNKSKGKKKRK